MFVYSIMNKNLLHMFIMGLNLMYLMNAWRKYDVHILYIISKLYIYDVNI